MQARERKKLLVAVALASGATLQCDQSAGIGLFDSGLGCALAVGFTSYCGVVGATTNCGVSLSCDDAGAGGGKFTTCTVPTPPHDCEITVTLEDGTQRTLPVTVTPNGPNCTYAGIYGTALPLECEMDGGVLDATDAMTDAADATKG